jgi:hypothetical protein
MTQLLSSWVVWLLIFIGVCCIIYYFNSRKGSSHHDHGLDHEVNEIEDQNFEDIEIEEDQNFDEEEYLHEPALPFRFPEIAASPPSYGRVVEEIPIPIPAQRYGSKGEEFTCIALSNLLGKQVTVGYRGNEFKNPETGRNLEIDCIDLQSKIGAEYNGSQHYVYPNRYHRSEEEFYCQLKRDKLKEALAVQNNLYLIKVPYIVDTHVQTLDGPVKRNHTPDTRYKRIYDYLKYVLQCYNRNEEVGPHYTTDFV